jgi:putative transcriptional regulator
MTRLLAVALLLFVNLLLPGVAMATDLAPGMLLVARDQIQDPRFRETVVLVLQHEPRGTVGLILNRPSRLPLAEAVPDQQELNKTTVTLSYGGPVAPEALLVLVAAGENPPIPALQVFGSLYVTGIEPLTAWLAPGRPAANYRVFLGYAGWGTGQLDREMQAGAWQVLPADAQQPFTNQLDSLWTELRKRDGEQPAPP